MQRSARYVAFAREERPYFNLDAMGSQHHALESRRRGDNSAFWDLYYPALMLTNTSYLRNSNYHQATDTPDTLDYPRMTDVTLGVASAMRRLLR